MPKIKNWRRLQTKESKKEPRIWKNKDSDLYLKIRKSKFTHIEYDLVLVDDKNNIIARESSFMALTRARKRAIEWMKHNPYPTKFIRETARDYPELIPEPHKWR